MGEEDHNQTQGGFNLAGILSSLAEVVAHVKTPLGFLTATLGLVGFVLVCFIFSSRSADEWRSLLHAFIVIAGFEVIAVMVTVFWRPGNLYERIDTIEDFIGNAEGIEDVIADVIEDKFAGRMILVDPARYQEENP